MPIEGEDHPSSDTSRLIELIEAVHLRLDDVANSLASGRPDMGEFAFALGEGTNAKKCNAELVALNRNNCHRVSIVSVDAGATVDITWTDAKGVVVNDLGLKGAEQTSCRCKMAKVQVHAQNGDATWMLVECKP